MLFSLYLVPLLALPQFVLGFSFELTSLPTQCGQLHVNITQGSGTPPYSILVVPFGASPVNPEKRTILSHSFNGSSTSFQMAYPADSDFVIALGDANGIGTGGTSAPAKVQASNDTSCLPNSVSTEYSFQVLPSNAINQCQPVTLAWNNQAQGKVQLQLIIPGGESSTIKESTIQSGLQGNTTGFDWLPNIPVGTNIIIVGGDSRGIATGGSADFSVGNNPNGDNSCINGNSPSSTPGLAAGAIETGRSTPDNNNNNKTGSSTNIGAIVGGVIAGIAAIIVAVLVTLFCVHRRRNQQRRRRQSLDLLPEIGQANEMYQPDPFIVPSTAAASSRHARTASDVSEDDQLSAPRPSISEGGRRYSTLSMTDASETTGYPGTSTEPQMRAGTGTYTSTSRKSPLPPVFRAVNYVQHEDAGQLGGPEGDGDGEPETVELPPNYDAIRR